MMKGDYSCVTSVISVTVPYNLEYVAGYKNSNTERLEMLRLYCV